jgi:hypothetical protein
MTEPGQPAQGRLIHFTPLRYPGGQAKLAAFVKSLLKENGLLDGEYVEPYAGGAAIALELLFHEYVPLIYVNDISKAGLRLPEKRFKRDGGILPPDRENASEGCSMG